MVHIKVSHNINDLVNCFVANLCAYLLVQYISLHCNMATHFCVYVDILSCGMFSFTLIFVGAENVLVDCNRKWNESVYVCVCMCVCVLCVFVCVCVCVCDVCVCVCV